MEKKQLIDTQNAELIPNFEWTYWLCGWCDNKISNCFSLFPRSHVFFCTKNVREYSSFIIFLKFKLELCVISPES